MAAAFDFAAADAVLDDGTQVPEAVSVTHADSDVAGAFFVAADVVARATAEEGGGGAGGGTASAEGAPPLGRGA